MDTSVVIANALVSCRLDYCNSLFRSLSSQNATRLQYVQNALARFVTGASKYTLHYIILHHISPCTNLPSIQDVPIPKICSFRFPLTVLPSINQRSILTIVFHMMPLSYGMIFHMIYAVLHISLVSKVDSKPTYFRNHSHHSFLLPNTG